MATLINQKLIDSGLLETLRVNQKKYTSIKESKRLVSVYENHIFVWHDSGSCILTSEINVAAEAKNSCCMKLSLSNPPVFEVDSLLFNPIGSLIALSGNNGVTIFHVPWRYGKFSAPNSDKDSVMGRSWNIAESFFVNSSRVSILQVSWHPGSSSNTHLTILSSDSYIRTYDVTDPQTPQQVITLGPSSKSSFLLSESKISFSTCFGENAVSFDFGPPEKMQVPQLNSSRVIKSYEEVTVWPIYLLHGSGDVYLVKSPLKRDRTQPLSKVLGPLAMYPQSDDNYRYDACSIICLHTVPPCIVIASATGVIYHSIVLENYGNLRKDGEFANTWDSPDDCDVALYVFESVDLPLSLTEEQDVYGHPIRMYKDITGHNKYHCTHMSGLHSIAVPFLQAIETYIEKNEGIEKLFLDDGKQPSIVEHILCTKPLSQMEPVPVLGLDVAINDTGVTMVCLLASWEFVCLPLVSSFFSSAPQLLSQDDNANKETDKASIPMFEQQIEKLLQRSVCSPYIKSDSLTDNTPISLQQKLDLVCNATQHLREDYLQRIGSGQALQRSRIKVLMQQKEYQLRDITKTLQNIESLKLGAEQLAEKYEDAYANQQQLLKRIETVFQKSQQNSLYLSKSEIKMKQTLQSYEPNLKVFESSIEQMKKKIKFIREKMVEAGDPMASLKTEMNNLNLSETQTKHVKELLMQEGESIAELIKTVSVIKQIGL
ncbi:hypothetical protein JTE90_022819 [Oedothorax gibbosus]|uniref:Nuclear pore complex protein Nup88 n=1 Tax=Oedothorax gibbosus TaxID=931172 RepID=A0AAV6V7B2_9ARAC|nr:hypothetical protein JTE90_022819 [Oedothorax gibbosus]